jgi:Skp family chaperone for outer membrane proteins
VDSVAIGVVNVQAILQKSAAGKNIQAQLDKKREEYQEQISAKENNLRDAEKKILDQKETLSEAEFAAKRKDFEQDVLSAQKMVQNNKRSLEGGFARALAKLRDDVRETVAEVAKERQYALVLSDDAVIIAEKSMDITDEVIKALDKRLTKVTIDWSVK